MNTMHETWVAVADLHGHLEQFDALTAFLDREYGNYILCTLGDYVDKREHPSMLHYSEGNVSVSVHRVMELVAV